MGFDLPFGDPAGMREYARKLRFHADSLESIVAPISLPSTRTFRGRTADHLRGRRDELRREAKMQHDRLYDLASWLDRRAADLEREIEEMRRLAEEAQRRMQEMFGLQTPRR